MSWLSKFVFDPVLANLARLAGSSHPPTAAAGQAALQAAQKLGQDGAIGVPAVVNGSLSPAGLGSTLLADLENGLNAVVGAYVGAAIPVIGPEIAPIAENILSLAEQHALTYVSALFSHHKATAVAATSPNVSGSPSTSGASSQNMKTSASSGG